MKWSPCTKTAYDNRARALAAIKGIKRSKKPRRRLKDLNEYECNRCGKWHLTSKTREFMKKSPGAIKRKKKP